MLKQQLFAHVKLIICFSPDNTDGDEETCLVLDYSSNIK